MEKKDINKREKKYSSPIVLRLGELDKGFGACAGGDWASASSGGCYPVGNSAHVTCNAGSLQSTS